MFITPLSGWITMVLDYKLCGAICLITMAGPTKAMVPKLVLIPVASLYRKSPGAGVAARTGLYPYRPMLYRFMTMARPSFSICGLLLRSNVKGRNRANWLFDLWAGLRPDRHRSL